MTATEMTTGEMIADREVRGKHGKTSVIIPDYRVMAFAETEKRFRRSQLEDDRIKLDHIAINLWF